VHATRIASARHYSRHAHGTFGLGVMERGAQRSASGRGEVEAHAGDVITTNPGEVHDGRPLDDAGRHWWIVYFEPPALTQALDSSAGRSAAAVELTAPVCQDVPLRAALRQLFAALERWTGLATPGPSDILACDEALAALGGLLPGRMLAGRPPAPARGVDLRAVRERLADEMLAPPSLAELAAMAGLSRFQLVRRFQRAHGLPPYRWLLMQRAELARRQIATGAALAHAAAQAGFADQSHMTRTFVSCFGFTPGAWRRSVAATRPRGSRRARP
jgi:AraC-like DNA-binding protein